MRYRYVLIAVFFLFSLRSIAQEKDRIKWIIRPSIGYNIPISTLSGGYITDNLVGFRSKTYYFQFISSTYFFNNLGIEFSFAAINNSKISNRSDKFESEVINKYSDQFYITASTSEANTDFNIVSRSIIRGGIGPVYKIEKDKFILIGRIMFMKTGIATEYGSADLKDKGTNERISINWKSGSMGKDVFTINPSITLGYKLFDKIFLDFDINYWQYKIDFEYAESRKNLNTKEIQIQKYTYSDLIKEISLGVGFIVVLN
jgi:hypothetical protein